MESHAFLGILRHSSLQEVGHSLKENHIHSVASGASTRSRDPTTGSSPKLNVLNDESAVHANELHSKSVTRKLRPSVNGISEDTVNFLPGKIV